MLLGRGSDFGPRRLSKHRSLLLLAIPLVLSAYTHLWNPVGFPFWHGDEIIYIGRAIGVLDHELLYGLYDHPFLGQVVLAGFMHVIGYPDLLLTSTDPSAVGMFHAIPRVLMGMLAVLDTFLVYKIAERRFGRRAAPIAAVLFAVMPVSLTLRMVLLDSILLPFVLASVLLAMHARSPGQKRDPPATDAEGAVLPAGTSVRYMTARGQSARMPIFALTGHRLLIVLSGVCMGCAILTKIPSVAMVPLVLALVYSANRSPRQALLWLVPVILIPMVWPASAMLAGEFDLWLDGVLWQSDRVNHPYLNALLQNVPILTVSGQDPDVLVHPLILLSAVLDLFEIDPVLMALGVAGLAFAAVTRNRFLLMWAAPVLLFFGSIGWVSYFHLGMLWTAMCVAAAALIGAGLARMPVGGGRPARDLALLAAVAAIAAFGMSTSGVLVHWDVTSAYLDGLYFTIQNYADSDVALLTEVPHTSIILSAYGLDGTDTSVPLDIPVKAKKTVMVVSPDSISRYRNIPGTGTDHDVLSAGVWVKHFWQSRYVEIYDAGSRVAEFSNPPRPDMQAITDLPRYVQSYDEIEVVEWSPPEWALLPTYTPDGQALRLDGSAHVTLAGTPDLDFDGTAPFSIAFWIRVSGADGQSSLIMSKWDESLHRGFFVKQQADGRLLLRMAADTSERITVNSFHSITDGHWHWVVFTYDGSGNNGGLNAYVDGRNDSFRWDRQSVAESTATGLPLVIHAGTTQDALLDDVRIYSEELPAEHISAIHECHRERAQAAAEGARFGAPVGGHACAGGGHVDALLAHLEFEGGLSDSSGNGNGGTARGDMRYG